MAEVFDRTGSGVLFVSVLAVTVALLAATGTAAAQSAPDCSTISYNGDGTTSNPYEVSNVDQLQCINEQELDANYVQVADIDASETASWNDGDGFEPIGDSVRRGVVLTGKFDGQGYSIAGLTIDKSNEDTIGLENTVGLFDAVASSGTVTNVSVMDADITGSDSVGVLAGENQGTIEKSYASGSVSGDNNVGGLVGTATRGMIKKSYAMVSVDGSGSVGGLVGFIGVERVTISESYAAGSVGGSEFVGGLVGNNFGGTVTESYWDTQATGQSSSDGGATGLTTSEMTGDAAARNMQGFDFMTTWETVSGDYPIFAWHTGSRDEIGESGDDDVSGSTDGSDDGRESPSSVDDAGTEGLPGFTVVSALLALLTVVAAASRLRKE